MLRCYDYVFLISDVDTQIHLQDAYVMFNVYAQLCSAYAERSIVANLFDRVLAYLFQFQVFNASCFMNHGKFYRNLYFAWGIVKETKKTQTFGSCGEKSSDMNKPNCFPVGILSHVHTHTNHFESSGISLANFLNLTLLLYSHFSRLPLSLLSMTSQKDHENILLRMTTGIVRAGQSIRLWIRKHWCEADEMKEIKMTFLVYWTTHLTRMQF